MVNEPQWSKYELIWITTKGIKVKTCEIWPQQPGLRRKMKKKLKSGVITKLTPESILGEI
jgi:hypothetical protein